jgi:hypothetical protein
MVVYFAIGMDTLQIVMLKFVRESIKPLTKNFLGKEQLKAVRRRYTKIDLIGSFDMFFCVEMSHQKRAHEIALYEREIRSNIMFSHAILHRLTLFLFFIYFVLFPPLSHDR